MPKIVVQAGHINVANNSIELLRKSTGAPGEQELTQRITDRVSSMLRDRGFDVKQTDANANDDPSITERDWDLFLAIHGDADAGGDNGGGMVGAPDPSVDEASIRSGLIKEAIRSEYFHHSEIVDKNFSTDGMLFYYMWRNLTGPTPCVLIELGQVQDPHDKVLLADTNRIASALVRGVCKAFAIPFDLPEPVPSPEPEPIPEPVPPFQTKRERARIVVDRIKKDMNELVDIILE